MGTLVSSLLRGCINYIKSLEQGRPCLQRQLQTPHRQFSHMLIGSELIQKYLGNMPKLVRGCLELLIISHLQLSSLMKLMQSVQSEWRNNVVIITTQKWRSGILCHFLVILLTWCLRKIHALEGMVFRGQYQTTGAVIKGAERSIPSLWQGSVLRTQQNHSKRTPSPLLTT